MSDESGVAIRHWRLFRTRPPFLQFTALLSITFVIVMVSSVVLLLQQGEMMAVILIPLLPLALLPLAVALGAEP